MYWWPMAIKAKFGAHLDAIVDEFGEPEEMIDCPSALGYDVETAYVLFGASSGWPVFAARMSSAYADAHLIISDELTEAQREYWDAYIIELRAYSDASGLGERVTP